MPISSSHPLLSVRQSLASSALAIYGTVLVFFVVLGVWLSDDMAREYRKILADTSYRAMQRSQILSQSFSTKILATDYVLSDVLGRIREQDITHPDLDEAHAQQMTRLLKEKADTVPDFFSMVVFDRDCVFTATTTGKNTGVRSKQALCEARKNHQGYGPLASYVPGTASVSGQSVIVLSRHIKSARGDFQGGVLGVIELQRAQHLFDSLSLGRGDSVALLDNDKILLARLPAFSDLIEKRVTTPDIPADLRASGSGSNVSTQMDIDGRERLFGFSKIEGLPFVVAYGIDKAKAIEDWQWRAAQIAAGFFTSLLLALLVARSYRATILQREALRASEDHFRMLAEDMADIVWKADAQMRFTYINTADQKVRGFPREEVIGSCFRDNLTMQGQGILDEQIRKRQEIALSVDKGIALKYELPMLHKNDGEVWIEMSSVPIYGSDGSISGYQGVGRDISTRKQHEAELLQSHQQLENRLHAVAEEKSVLQELTMRDSLTGLHNRRFLDAALSRELARTEREGNQLAVIVMDLDHFKNVNDQYGHAAGDETLKMLAELLKRGARESDLICRYGGEEFVAIMPGMSADQALERAESWRNQLEEAIIVCGDSRISITLSAGIAVFPDHGNTPSLLLAGADKMLYKAKAEGRNRISVCTRE